MVHEGDIVDSDVPTQWQAAAGSLHMLDGQVPYVIAAGNHDYANLADRMGLASSYFPPSGFAQFSWFGGTYEPEDIENSFSLIPAGSTSWVVLSLEFGPRDEVLARASSVLERFRDRPAIVVTHGYLYHDGTRYNRNAPIKQRFAPSSYVMMGQPGTSVNDGEDIWRKLIEPNANVKLVLSGHDVGSENLPPGTAARLTSLRADGSVVHQLLANYQTCLRAPCAFSPRGTLALGGSGYLRVLRVSERTNSIAVTTYSPYLGRFLSDPSNQFVLEMK